ncbi:hypothetical protein TWF751_008543 [Orbilia oligospora]|nr:hypothetical protein TWF751_008543 [Orbilia oligospora]
MPIYKGIDTSLVIDGAKAQEYNKSINYFTSTVTTYIVAEEGSTYTMDFGISKREMGAERHHIHIIIDGKTVLKQTTLLDNYNVDSVFFRDPKKSDCIRRAKLIFAGPAGLSTDGKSNKKAAPQKLGTIEVRLRREELETSENIFSGCPFFPNYTESNGSYQTEYNLGETVLDRPQYVKTISIDTRRPWVTFKFKYGSKEQNILSGVWFHVARVFQVQAALRIKLLNLRLMQNSLSTSYLRNMRKWSRKRIDRSQETRKTHHGGGIRAAKYDSGEYLVVTVELQAIDSVLQFIDVEIHLVDKLRANLLLGNGFLVPERAKIDYQESIVVFPRCRNAVVLVKVIHRGYDNVAIALAATVIPARELAPIAIRPLSIGGNLDREFATISEVLSCY